MGETDGCVYTAIVSGFAGYVQDQEYILSVMATGTRGSFNGGVIGTVSVYGGSYPPQFSQEEYSASVQEDQANQV